MFKVYINKTLFLVISFILFLTSPASAASSSSTEQFIRWYSLPLQTGWYHGRTVESIIETTDHSVVVAGYTYNSINNHATMTKYYSNGTLAWEVNFGSGEDGQATSPSYSDYFFYKVIQLANGDFLGIGQTNENLGITANGYSSVFAVRIDENGNTLWQKAYGLNAETTNLSAWEASENTNGSISLWGTYQSWSGTWSYPVMLELTINESGDQLSSTVISDDSSQSTTISSNDNGLKATADGGFLAYQNILAGGVWWTDTLVKVNDSGQQEWSLALIPQETSTGFAGSAIKNSKIIVLSDGYLIAGIITIQGDNNSVTSAPMVYRLDLDGNVQWTKIYPNMTLTNRTTDIFASQTSNNEVLLSVENGYSTIDFTIFKIDPTTGAVSWAKSYGSASMITTGNGGDTKFTMIENNAGQIIGAGSNFITKFAGDGRISFITDQFTYQDRSNYQSIDIEVDQYPGAGFLNTFELASSAITSVDLSRLTGLTAYEIDYVTSGETGQGELTGFLAKNPSENFYLYDKEAFNNSYLAYQINPSLSSARMYQHYVDNSCQIVALKDLTRGYMDYQAAATASLFAQIKGQAFNINDYFASDTAVQYTETISDIWIVNIDGSISF